MHSFVKKSKMREAVGLELIDLSMRHPLGALLDGSEGFPSQRTLSHCDNGICDASEGIRAH